MQHRRGQPVEAVVGGGVAELHRQDLGQAAVIQPVAHRHVTGAWPPDAVALDTGPGDRPVLTQGVEVEPDCGDVQVHPLGEFSRVDCAIGGAHQPQHPLALLIARQPLTASGAVPADGLVVHGMPLLEESPTDLRELIR
nr:hypothetical protein CPGR_03279 [Mycolicibacter nonchromogenicus]